MRPAQHVHATMGVSGEVVQVHNREVGPILMGPVLTGAVSRMAEAEPICSTLSLHLHCSRGSGARRPTPSSGTRTLKLAAKCHGLDKTPMANSPGTGTIYFETAIAIPAGLPRPLTLSFYDDRRYSHITHILHTGAVVAVASCPGHSSYSSLLLTDAGLQGWGVDGQLDGWCG